MPIPPAAAAILEYWTSIGPQGWYAGGDDLDTEIKTRFLSTWEAANNGAFQSWQSCPEGMLAYLVLTDQFPRNMFRGDPRSFATDARARAVATRAWQHDHDLRIEAPLRQFFYMPFMHSESSFDQDRCVCLMLARMPPPDDPDPVNSSALHACVHREIIRRFRRFPYRNTALGRVSSAQEEQFLKDGGYGEILQSLTH